MRIASSPLRTLLAATGLLAAVATLPGCPPPGKGPTAEAAYSEATPVIAALERFRAAKGQYPDTLAALVPEFAQSVPAETGPGTTFSYKHVGNSFELTFTYTGPGVNHCDYLSTSATWHCGGYY